MKLKNIVKPKNINTKVKHYFSTFGNCEAEVVARNIIIISKKRGEWFDFSWEDYKSLITHEYTQRERDGLNHLVSEEYLIKTNGTDVFRYAVTDKFIASLQKYYL